MLAAVALACAACPPAGAAAAARSAASCRGANLRPSASDARAVEAATLCLIDQVRLGYRLPPLRANRELGAVASSQVSSMVRWNYFADVRPSGQTPMTLVSATRYPAHAAGVAVGQNIAWGAGRNATPARIVAAWMASPPHREIILSGEFRDAGVGVTPAVPSVLSAARHGAVYAIELGARL
jgi:uncharacterized protein YkwD